MPTYSLTRSASSVAEGDQVSFTLTTTGLPDGSVVGYQLSGVTPPDINNVILTGNFVISSGVSTVGVNVTADYILEGTENLVLSLVNGEASISVSVIDTSYPIRHVFVKDNDVWREPQQIFLKNSNEWKAIKKIYAKSEGTWKLVFDKETWSVIASTVAQSFLTDPWNVQTQATLTINFNNASDANYFFNRGGKIRFRSTREGGTGSVQNGAWSFLLNYVGTKAFTGYWADGFNFFKLTNSYQTFYYATSSAPYASNYYKIEVLCDVPDNGAGTASQLTFRFTWNDGYITSPLYGMESGVDGTLLLSVEEVKPIAPSTETPVTSPTYSLSSIVPMSISNDPLFTYVNEGSTITFTVNTEGFANGTMLYYNITGAGISASDFVDNAVNGSFTIVADTGSFAKTLRNDNTTEGTETFTMNIRMGSITGPIIASSRIIVPDTSMTP